MKSNRILLVLIFVLLSLNSFGQKAVTGEVTDVIDGRTFVLVTPQKVNFKVRLQYVDPPEVSQPLYDQVKSHLADLIKGKTVTAQIQSLQNGVSISRVLLGDVDVSMQMLRDGAVWYTVPETASHADEERSKYLETEQLAKVEKRGVWSIANIRPAFELRAEREKAEHDRLEAEMKATLEKAARSGLPTRPVVGMAYTEFLMVCGSTDLDAKTLTQTPDGATFFVTLYKTPERIEKGCFGSFSFDTKSKLDYIRQTNY